MSTFIKAAAIAVITIFLYLILLKQSKDFATALSITVCCLIGLVAFQQLTPVFAFVDDLVEVGRLDQEQLNVLIKAVGISLLSEFTGLICADAGNAALGKVIKVLSSAIILTLSLPLLTDLMDLVKNILLTV